MLEAFFCSAIKKKKYFTSRERWVKMLPYEQRLGYVRNPRSLMEGTETLCRDDIGIYLEAPIISDLREKANEIG